MRRSCQIIALLFTSAFSVHVLALPVSREVHKVGSLSTFLPREPNPASTSQHSASVNEQTAPHSGSPSHSPSHSHTDDPVTPPGHSASLPVTPPQNHGANNPQTPYSPYKADRDQALKTNIKAAELKDKKYRVAAIKKAEEGDLEFDPSMEADHLLEPQTVAFYINQHRGSKAVKVGCKNALIAILNAPANLEMLDKESNGKKRDIVALISRRKKPGEADGEGNVLPIVIPPFSKTLSDHILKNAKAIVETAQKVDEEFQPGKACEDIIPGAPKGIERSAERMIEHARQSLSEHATSRIGS